MSQKVTITYFGMEGTGRTLTEAKRDAGAKIERALTDSYTPEILSYRGYAILLYREPDGWHDRIITSPEDGIRAGKVYGGSSPDREDFKAVRRRALCHLANIAWLPADGLTPPDFLTDRSDIADFKHSAEFQTRYIAARDKGMADLDAHSYAGRNPARYDLWKDDETKAA